MLTSRNLIALVALGAGLSLTSCAEDSADSSGDDAGAADDDAADDDAADDDAADDDAADDDAADDDAADDDAADDDAADDDVVETDAGGDDDVVETDAGGDDDVVETDAGGDDDVVETDAGGDDDVVETDAGGDDDVVETDAGGDDDVVETDSGSPAAPAVAKFCNSLSFNDADTTLVLAVGEGDAQVTFTATTGECVPADGLACTEVPAGTAVLVELFDAEDDSAPLDSSTTTIDAGGEYAFYTEILEAAPVWTGVILDGDLTCSEFNYESF